MFTVQSLTPPPQFFLWEKRLCFWLILNGPLLPLTIVPKREEYSNPRVCLRFPGWNHKAHLYIYSLVQQNYCSCCFPWPQTLRHTQQAGNLAFWLHKVPEGHLSCFESLNRQSVLSLREGQIFLLYHKICMLWDNSLPALSSRKGTQCKLFCTRARREAGTQFTEGKE